MYAAEARPVRAFGLDFRNPVGLAAGYDKDADAIHGLAALGFGHVEVGTITPNPQPGNPQPRLFRLVEDEAVINRLGFPSRGSEYVQKRLGRLYREGPRARVKRWTSGGIGKKATLSRSHGNLIVGVNLGKNKETPHEQAVLDYLALLQNFAPLADYLVINISSPNTPGLRQLQGRGPLEALLAELHAQRLIEQRRLEKRVPLLVKLAPDLSDHELDAAVGVSVDKRMDGLIVTNTTLAREGLSSRHHVESGGLSGSPLRRRADDVLARAVARANGQLPVVGVGGIMRPEDARRKIDLGATLIQVYTGLIYRGPGLVKEIVRALL
jgi:dihydroorotate dehydrogenase